MKMEFAIFDFVAGFVSQLPDVSAIRAIVACFVFNRPVLLVLVHPRLFKPFWKFKSNHPTVKLLSAQFNAKRHQYFRSSSVSGSVSGSIF